MPTAFFRRTGLLLALLVVLFSGCSIRPLKLGVALPLSGAGTARGQEILNAVMLAVDDVNKAGGVKGRKVELAIQDDRDLPEQGREAAQKLIAQDVIGVIGHYSSDVTLEALPVYVEAQTALISPSVTLSKVPHEGQFFFRTIGDNRLQTHAVAQFIRVGQYQRVAVVSNSSLFGKDLAETVMQTLQKETGPVLKQYEDQPELMDILLKDLPELVFYAGGYRDAALFLQRLREKSQTIDFVGGNSLHDPEFIRLAGMVNTQRSWIISDVPPLDSDFASRYQQRFGQPGLFSPYAYDATRLLLQAAEGARGKPAGVTEALRRMASYEGLTGSMTVNPGLGATALQSYEILSISPQGSFELFDPENAAPRFGAPGQIAGTWARMALP
ncbi:MAG: branched-chain amino acid ABC transporter substrate-binding protein [Candidatus Sericytochromatia bacterium]|nr:branched-chain amino acid ABC transporter substrate-binding protein [Candidatus Sericytochromatia bacterium]